MNLFAPGPRELARILDRLGRRTWLVWARRRLARLEARLGLLGWQQADYDPATQRHVNRLTDYERAQAQLTNESAALGLTIQQLDERRAAERATFERQRTERLAAQKPLAEPLEESEKALAALQSERARLEERLSVIDAELSASEEKYRAVLARGSVEPEDEAEVIRLQRRTLSIPQEKQEWQFKLNELLNVLPRAESEVHERRALLSVEVEALRRLENSFTSSDEALVEEIADRKREKQKIERRIDEVEKAKTRPYREIGRALADQAIAPVNQPEALSVVVAQRESIATEERQIAASMAASGAEKRAILWGSSLLWLIIIALMASAFWLLVRSR